MLDLLAQPWPWWIAGPLIGLVVPLLFWIGGRKFGVSSNFQHLCAMVPSRIEYFRYDWRRTGGWQLALAAGLVLGGALAHFLLPSPDLVVAISAATTADLQALGINDFEGLAPREIFSWSRVGTANGLIFVVLGGFLVGFGARYAGSCTSGHGISGLSLLQLTSLVAVLGFFAGGLLITHLVFPWIL